MELENFISKALTEIIRGVRSAASNTNYGIRINSTEGTRSVEFDVAVSSETITTAGGAAETKISVLSIGGVKGDIDYEKADTNSRVSRVRFGVNIGYSPEEVAEQRAQIRRAESHNHAY